jgi:long-chain acyl-CoA synthetase
LLGEPELVPIKEYVFFSLKDFTFCLLPLQNVNELFNDIAALKPTFLVGAPRVWSRLYDKLTLTINTSGALKQKLFHWGFAAKQKALKLGQPTPFWDKILFSKMQARLGGRVRFILSGSAPLDPKLGEFLKM